MNQKKKTTMAHNTLPNVHSYASIRTPPCEARFRALAEPTPTRGGLHRGERSGGNG